MNETIAIGERGGLPTQVTHHKIIGRPNWGKSVETLQAVDEARARGVDVTIDEYPYTASSTSIQGALFPAWAQEGGRKQVLARLADPATRPKIKAEIVRVIKNERGGGDPRNIVVASCDWDASLAGKNLSEVTERRGLQPTVEDAAEAAMWLVAERRLPGHLPRHRRGGSRADSPPPGDHDRVGRRDPDLRQGEPAPAQLRHVRARARRLRARTPDHHARGRRAQDDRRFPPQRLGLLDRGLVRPGMKADLVVFDPARVRDLATFEKPHQYAEGISRVITNGQVVFERGAMTAARPGAVLYGPGRSSGRR